MSFSDADLIARVLLNDDHHAFGELARRHQSAVRNMLRKLTAGDYALADDVAQETFIRAYRSLAKYRGTGKFSSWLYRIAYNLFISHIRKKREYTTSSEDNPIEGEVAPQTERVQLKLDLAQAMKQLKEQERAAISLCYQKGLSHEEAAEALNCPIGTVKTNILRGKNKLRIFLQEWNTQAAG